MSGTTVALPETMRFLGGLLSATLLLATACAADGYETSYNFDEPRWLYGQGYFNATTGTGAFFAAASPDSSLQFNAHTGGLYRRQATQQDDPVFFADGANGTSLNPLTCSAGLVFHATAPSGYDVEVSLTPDSSNQEWEEGGGTLILSSADPAYVGQGRISGWQCWLEGGDQPDSDLDGIPDVADYGGYLDNCVGVKSYRISDQDQDGFGDLCDRDIWDPNVH